MTLTFIVPMPPNVANRQMHHMVKHRIKRGYWAVLDAALLGRFNYADLRNLGTYANQHASKGIPELKRDAARLLAWLESPLKRRVEIPAAPLPRASVRSIMHVGARMDVGNSMNRHKWVEDWLTERGFIVDDSEAHFQWTGFPTQIVKRDGNYRIELSVTPM